MTRRADAGDIVDQEAVPIGPDDTALEVQKRVTAAAVAVLARRIEELKAGRAKPTPQDESQASRFGRRRPEDGRIDLSRPREEVHDLVRAVTHPFPGAFTDVFGGKTFVWRTACRAWRRTTPSPARSAPRRAGSSSPAATTATSSCCALQREGGQEDGRGRLHRAEGGLMRGPDPRRQRLHRQRPDRAHPRRRPTGTCRAWTSARDKIAPFLENPRFTYLEGDIAINKEWIEYQVKKCDVVLPLVAIATPAAYVQEPLAVFELDFEENLRIVKQAVRYGKRVVFPSTSEVYGMCPDAEFDEDSSPLVYGPIHKQRWIYSCIKQLLDRVIWAYGEQGPAFTLFRPFNWFGPHLDDIDSPKEGSSRVLTQFLHNILYGEPIKLVDGGTQRRSFTYISDGIDALMTILENRGRRRRRRHLQHRQSRATTSRSASSRAHDRHGRRATPGSRRRRGRRRIVEVSSGDYYGEGYQDILTRVPSIRRARQSLGWEPKVGLDEGDPAHARFLPEESPGPRE